MRYLWLYRSLSRLRLNFRAKIMLVAFIDTHIPLIALIAWAAARTSQGWTSSSAPSPWRSSPRCRAPD